MVEVRFLRKNERLVSYSIDGHAEYSEPGSDIVCAAVSALAITIYNGIDEILKIPNLCDTKDDGYLAVSIDSAEASDQDKAQLLLETLKLGIEQMKSSYEEYINLIIEEV
ncbi:ribosomal-processing cysteine protease Prp [Clostridium cellulovorans]|uniref:Ribosomal processing cysteine protease Prp n=1 Tax=Clostridium cellulovorans (strain ATCC 35296 / DSM 3052 / OCM 3 / 743B) TaxID=573061 RepID=D9SS01_CLOC7|nr:ribosomal-processing cysteine protease Prp [Clostridium cellulovorans]ADL52448.1 protein of unknown function DUF464 [Clostridium cellulovorans 743B]